MAQWRKWLAMCIGRSVQHAPQGKGSVYVCDKVWGYYIDLRSKFLGDHGAQALDEEGIPVHWLSNGRKVYLPTAVAQYGLGAYDVYLESSAQEARDAFISTANWLLNEQDEQGGWPIWTRLGMNGMVPYSAMTQGEGASLLYRAANETGTSEYRIAADRAIECMLASPENGGTARWETGRLVLEEKVESPPSAILNGWIFAIFGLHDGVLVSGLPEWRHAFQLTSQTLAADLNEYDAGYWSMYDRRGHLASPFYHHLHIAQLAVLAELTGERVFAQMANRWRKYSRRCVNRWRAFCVKAVQKLQDPGEVVLVR